MSDGWDAFRSRSWLWTIVLQFAFVNAAIVGVWSVLGPVVAKNDLGGAAAWGFILAAQAAGFVFGSVVMLRYRPNRLLLVATLAIFPTALPILLLTAPAPVIAIALAAFVSGVGVEVFGVLWDVTMQQEVSVEQLSRVYSYDALGSFVVIPLGAAIAGPLAERIGTAEALAGSALLILVATSLVLLIDEVRNLRRKPVEATASS